MFNFFKTGCGVYFMNEFFKMLQEVFFFRRLSKKGSAVYLSDLSETSLRQLDYDADYELEVGKEQYIVCIYYILFKKDSRINS